MNIVLLKNPKNLGIYEQDSLSTPNKKSVNCIEFAEVVRFAKSQCFKIFWNMFEWIGKNERMCHHGRISVFT
jgi:hypothetical protein